MLPTIDIKQVYSSESDDLINDFYIPMLSNSTSYSRITGYFSAGVIRIASRGMANFFFNGGKYRLMMGVEFNAEDYKTILKTNISPEKIAIDKLYFDSNHFVTEIEKDYLRVFSYLLATGVLEIRIAIIDKDKSGIFHEKIGIFEDTWGNVVSFSGSINETAAAWGANVEEFKVYRSWEAEDSYQTSDINKFERYWDDKSPAMKVITLPEAIKEKIISFAPRNNTEVNDLVARINKVEKRAENDPRELYPYQKNAVSNWVKNSYCGSFEMATGTGKTLTSIGGLQEIYEKDNKLFAVVAVPYKHLVGQWRKDIERQLPKAYIVESHSSSPGWRRKLKEVISDYCDGVLEIVVVIPTHATFGSVDFIDQISRCKDVALIADEMHNLGAPQLQKGLIESYRYRIGLSATPIRPYDEDGNEFLARYFKKTVYKFPLAKAIKDGWLTPYHYYPVFVELSEEEFAKYAELSIKITKASMYKDDNGGNSYLESLLRKRSQILKKGENKLSELDLLLKKLLNAKEGLSHLLIYCDQGGQLDDAQQIVGDLGIISHRFTQTENIKERKEILKHFDNGKYECLLAIKCLDEGVDIPSTTHAIILASSANPREYIQRRGRVLRKYPGKKFAVIYDFVVLPGKVPNRDTQMFKYEQKIIEVELKRAYDFISTAENRAESFNAFYPIMKKFNVYFKEDEDN